MKQTITTIFLASLSLLAGCSGTPFGRNAGKEARGLELNREGISAFEREEYGEASEKFVQAVKNNENDLNSRRYYAEILWLEGKQNEAFRYLADAATREGSAEEKAAISESLAEKFLEIDQPTAALHYAEKVIDLTPKRHEGWELRAMLNQKIGKKKDALADYHRALQLAPNDRDLLRSLALFESEEGNDRAALAAWEELGRFYPGRGEPSEILCGKAEACRRLGRVQEAVDYCSAAMKQDPENPEIYNLLADIYLENKDTDSAQAVAAQAADRFPTNKTALLLQRRIEEVGMKETEKRF